MNASVTREAVWAAIEKNTFAVLGWVNGRGEPRSAGIVYAVHDHQLYISTDGESWKARQIAQNPAVSVTVTIPRRVPLMPWIKVPAAVATFNGEAKLHEVHELDPATIAPLMKGLKMTDESIRKIRIIRVQPMGHAVTYGIGVSVMAMRDPERARARVPV